MAEPILDAPRVAKRAHADALYQTVDLVGRERAAALASTRSCCWKGRRILAERIDCYQVAKRSAGGAAFKLDPSRLVYSLKWKHNAEPPDYEVVLIQDEPVGWVHIANLVLLGALRRWLRRRSTGSG